MFAAKNALYTPYEYPSFEVAGAGSTTITSKVVTEAAITRRGNCVVAALMTFAGKIATCTCGGVAMTGGTEWNNNTIADGGLQFFWLKNPPDGSQSVAATFTTSPTYAALCSLSFFNVHTIGTLDGGDGTGSGAKTQAVTTTPGGIVVGAVCGYSAASATPLSAFLQTQEYSANLGSYVMMLLGYSKATSTSVTVGATSAGSGEDWSILGLSLT